VGMLVSMSVHCVHLVQWWVVLLRVTFCCVILPGGEPGLWEREGSGRSWCEQGRSRCLGGCHQEVRHFLQNETQFLHI
jgi:hypothetical protein